MRLMLRAVAGPALGHRTDPWHRRVLPGTTAFPASLHRPADRGTALDVAEQEKGTVLTNLMTPGLRGGVGVGRDDLSRSGRTLALRKAKRPL